MKRERLMLKHPAGWFAAGREFAEAMELLSEGAFKLYVYACLQADRHTGRIVLEHARMTSILRQCPDRIATHLNELGQCGVLHIDPGLNGGKVALVEIHDRFWPYRKQKTTLRPGSEQACFIGKVRDLFLAPACVRAVFTAADESITSDLYDRGVSLEQIRRAILLGCARKYVSMINGQTRMRISSLQYFVPLVDEVMASAVPESYWEPLRRKVEQMEQRWRQTQPRNEVMPVGSVQQ
jgi:hypothetical protein